MVKNYFWVVILLFLSIFAYICADFAEAVLRSKLKKEDSIALEMSSEIASASEKKEDINHWSRDRLMKMKNIFNPASVLIEEETVSADETNETDPELASNELTATGLPFKLLGIAYGPPDLAAVIIYNGKNRGVYQIDEKVTDFEKVTIAKIERERVILNNGGKREFLARPEDTKPVRGKRGKRGRGKTKYPTQKKNDFSGADSTTIEISKREKEAAWSKIGVLMTQIRVVPNLKRGKMDGFRVFDIKRNSIFQKVGLKNGDIIKQINGVTIDAAETALKLSEQLKDETNFSIDLVRKGENMHFDIDVR